MSGRDGYTPVVSQEPGAPPRLRWRRQVVLASGMVTALALGVVLVGSVVQRQRAAQVPPEARTSAPVADAEELFEMPGWMQQVAGTAAAACQGASGMLHISLCTTSTGTTTTSSTTHTTTATTTTTSHTTTSTSVTTTTKTTTSTTKTVTSTTSTTKTTTSTTITTTTITTTPWLEKLRWVGCYESLTEKDFVYQNTLPRPYGYTSTACARVCAGFRYVLLTDNGRCTCMAVHPETPDFGQVEKERCGHVCETEEELLPERRCGGELTFAIFRIESAAEVREEIETGTAAKSHLGEDIWPSWPQERKGATPKAVGTATARRGKHVLKGISYGPVPLRTHGRLPDDDFMSESTEALWGKKGRADLSIIKALGANTVRLYGNDPALDHTAFLDEAMKQGLQVIAGISDYPYTQMPGSCVSTHFDCYNQVRQQYAQNLKRGFLAAGNVYHPALRTVILMNEPDLKFPGGPRMYCKALVSAFDAALDAEREMGVAGQAPAFTATFSFGVCPGCAELGNQPAIGQMIELRNAMMHPESVGYHTRNDIWAAYQARFINSANTANPATDIRRLFLDAYDATFHRMPVFIGEYHNPRTLDQKRDLEMILDIASNESTMLQGISFFEYQVRYDKGGSEKSFGMFGLEDRSVTDMRIGNGAFSAWCLKPLEVAEVAGHMYKNQCGAIEVGVDYVSDSPWAIPMDHIPTPEFCCQQCQDNPKCWSWTWVEDAGLTTPGMPSQCWLKGGLPSGKVPKDGVISGIPAGKAPPPAVRRLRGPWNAPADAPPSGAAAPQAHVEQMHWGQCGGKFWNGPKKCAANWRCKMRSEFYAQCVPDDADKSVVVPEQVQGQLPNIYVHMAVQAAFAGDGVTAAQLCPTATTTATTTSVTTTTSRAALASKAKLKWFGCYEHSTKSSYVYSKEKGGFTSSICVRGCAGYSYALLHDSGHCSCASTNPRNSHFHEVHDEKCGKVCAGETGLSPKRYCGGEDTFAVYEVPSEDAPEDTKDDSEGHEFVTVGGSTRKEFH